MANIERNGGENDKRLKKVASAITVGADHTSSDEMDGKADKCIMGQRMSGVRKKIE